MKPLKITMQAFGPYTREVTVDFNLLKNNKLFLVAGSTGGGKTTILDAMCFALYCRATGGLRTWQDMRNISINDDVETFVDFEFMLGEETYRFKRKLKIHIVRGKNRKELRYEHECWKKEGQNWSLVLSGSETMVREYAEKLIGLNCEQFSTIIVLPQGEFRKLLLASSKEKLNIFHNLFPVERWEKISFIVKKMAEDLQLKKEASYIKRDSILKRQEVKDIDELTQKLEMCKKEHDLTKANIQNIEKNILSYTNKIENLQNFNKSQNNLERLKLQVKNMQTELEIKGSLKSQAKEDAKTIPSIQKEINMRITKVGELESAIKGCIKIKRLEHDLTQYIKYKEKNEQSQKHHQDNLNEARDNIKKGELYIQKVQEEIQKVPNLFIEFKKRQDQINDYNVTTQKRKEYLKLKDIYKQETEEFNLAKVKLNSLKVQFEISQEKLRKNMAVVLSKLLNEGEPCPVCGSREHPDLAVYSSIEDISTEQEVELLRKSITKEQAGFEEKQSALYKTKAKFESKKEDYEGQLKSFSKEYEISDSYYKTLVNNLEKAKKELELAQKAEQLLPKARELLEKRKAEYELAIERLEELKKEFIKINIEIEKINSSKEVLISQFNATSKINEIQNELTNTNMFIKKEETKIKELQSNLIKYENEFNICEANLKNLNITLEKEKQINEELKKIIKEDEHDIYELKENLEDLKLKNQNECEKVGRLTHIYSMMKGDINEIIKLEKDSEASDKNYTKVVRISKCLQGKNQCNTPIKMFVLGIMLDDVISCANIYFLTLTNNRYALSRVTEKVSGTGYRGLDLEVFDSYHGGTRAVGTLSGGELFLASLSLAFGLSDVVQSYSGGVRLDSLFIDEGFGSLDSETLDTAMKALNKIQKMGRTVGIISHVNELKDRIKAKIEIQKEENGGSKISIRV